MSRTFGYLSLNFSRVGLGPDPDFSHYITNTFKVRTRYSTKRRDEEKGTWVKGLWHLKLSEQKRASERFRRTAHWSRKKVQRICFGHAKGIKERGQS